MLRSHLPPPKKKQKQNEDIDVPAGLILGVEGGSVTYTGHDKKYQKKDTLLETNMFLFKLVILGVILIFRGVSSCLPRRGMVKMDGWNTIVFLWGPAYFQGRIMLVLGECTPSPGFGSVFLVEFW